MSFRLSLTQRWETSDSLLCVGLDPDPRRIPQHLGRGASAILAFCRDIVDATADHVCAFKPQIAYFAAARAESALEELIHYIHEEHPGIPVILDAKRGDIGHTAEQYAAEAFERYKADALTVSPFMGLDSIEPYLAWPGKGVILLCRTSNPGSGDFQLLESGGEPLFERIARLAATEWNRDGELGLVVGATYPEELRRVRQLAPGLPLLVPGIGAQGGDVETTVKSGLDDHAAGLVINSSRAILFAGHDRDFASAARAASQQARDEIRRAVTALTSTGIVAD
ncbi:MAG TPA: orotidine-5'-phosphate decarboxylase [Lautropia sp.]|nr:orotidine-5'-phosphate decarboxylase [Lautropia sp.]